MANPVKIKAEVVKIIDHTDGIFTVFLKPEKRVPRFKTGQFLHLALDDYDPCGGYWPESRVFSIASAPSSEHIEIVYSVKGRYTARMSKELTIGKLVEEYYASESEKKRGHGLTRMDADKYAEMN